MKITQLCLLLLLIYQLLQQCNATDNGVTCIQRQIFESETIEAHHATIPATSGSNHEISALMNDCNGDYVLLHQNHHNGTLVEVTSQHENRKFILSDVQIETSGIYCAYKKCSPSDREQCCIRITVQPEMKMIFPDVVDKDTPQYGVCYVRAWPILAASTDHIDVYTAPDRCAITKHSISHTDTYTTSLFFTLDNINSSCLYINCWTQFNITKKYPNILLNTTTTMPTIPTDREYPTGNNDHNSTHAPITEPNPVSQCTCSSSSGGVLGIYRITLWIIVLTLTILSMAMTSLIPGL